MTCLPGLKCSVLYVYKLTGYSCSQFYELFMLGILYFISIFCVLYLNTTACKSDYCCLTAHASTHCKLTYSKITHGRIAWYLMLSVFSVEPVSVKSRKYYFGRSISTAAHMKDGLLAKCDLVTLYTEMQWFMKKLQRTSPISFSNPLFSQVCTRWMYSCHFCV